MIKLLTEHLAEPFRDLLLVTLFNTKGNQSKAARILGISRGSLRTYLKHFDLLDKDLTTVRELVDLSIDA